jgi:hypothetical protein
MTRKRRILIAAVAVVGVLLLWGLKPGKDKSPIVYFLARHPYAFEAAHRVVVLLGVDADIAFQIQIGNARSELARQGE